TVILPSLSRHHVNTDHAGFSRALDWGLRTTLLISIPAMLGLVLLAKPIVATLFEHGRFGAHDVDMVALSLAALSFGLPAFALVKVLAPAFYARQDTKTPVRAGVAAMTANMLLNVLFVGGLYVAWGGAAEAGGGFLTRLAAIPGLHLGIALASSVASYLNLWLLWRGLRRDGVYRREAGWGRHLLRLTAACATLVVVILVGLHWWPQWSGASIGARAWHLGAIILVGGVAYLGSLLALGLRLRDLRGG
ncbi:MAG: lipid II flippase MurJ, partial [Rudaea sp.]